MYRFCLLVVLLNIGMLSATAAEKPVSEPLEGFYMTGMSRDTVRKETEVMKFKGMRRETATRVLKETSNKKK